MKTLSTILILVLSSTSASLAGSLNKQHIAADASWVIHVDIEAASNSTIGRAILENPEQFDFLDDLHDADEELGFNLIEELRNVTLYGIGDDPDNAIAVVSISDQIDQLLAKLQEHEDSYEQLTVNDFTIHSWTDDDERIYAYVGSGTKQTERSVVIGDEWELVVAGVKVLEGESPNLTDTKEGGLVVSPRDDAIVFIAATDVPAMLDDEQVRSIAECSDSIVLQFGEADENTYIEASVSAKTEDDARNIVDIAQGVVALARLATQYEQNLAPFHQLARAISVNVDGRRINVNVSAPSEELMRQLASLE